MGLGRTGLVDCQAQVDLAAIGLAMQGESDAAMEQAAKALNAAGNASPPATAVSPGD